MFKINNKNLISLGLLLLATFAFVFVSIPRNANANTNFDNCDSLNFNGWYAYSCNYNYSNVNSNNLNPVPFIASVNPSSAKVNTNTIITIKGSGFISGSIIKWNNTNKSTTFVDSGTLRTQLDSHTLNSKGNYEIVVFNPTPGGGFSNAVSFTVKSNPAPVGNVSGNSQNNSSSNNSTNNTNTTTETNNQSTSEDNNVSDLAANAVFGTNGFFPSGLFGWFFFIILILLVVILWRKLYTENNKATPLKHA